MNEENEEKKIERVCISLSPELKQNLKKDSFIHQLSVSQFIRKLYEEWKSGKKTKK